jgi:hypothetical protein
MKQSIAQLYNFYAADGIPLSSAIEITENIKINNTLRKCSIANRTLRSATQRS